MDDMVQDLYQKLIMERSRAPHHAGRLGRFDAEAEGDNPMCGDRVHVTMACDDGGMVRDFAHETRGCAICIASADLLGDVVIGRPIGDIGRLADDFEAMITTGSRPDSPEFENLGALAGVHAYRSRHRCATLPWQAVRSAIAQMVETHHG